MTGYNLSADLEVLQQLLRATEEQRWAVIDLLERLRQQPFMRGDFQEVDDTGRSNEVMLTGGALVLFWTDHAVKTVRVTKIELVEED